MEKIAVIGFENTDAVRKRYAGKAELFFDVPCESNAEKYAYSVVFLNSGTEKTVIKKWLGNEHLRLAANEKALFEEMDFFLGIPEPLEIERKFLIEKPVESELQHSHSGETRFFEIFNDLIVYDTEILRHYLRIFDALAHRFPELHSGSRSPFTLFRRFCVCGYRPVFAKTAEMIYAEDIVHFEVVDDTLRHPGVAVPFHRLVIVKRIAPELSVLREIIRRHSRDFGGFKVLIESEIRGVRPHVGRIVRYVYRHISEYLDAQGIDVLFEFRPLRIEKVLLEFVIQYVGGKSFARLSKRVFIPEFKLIVPFAPFFAGVVPYRHIEAGGVPGRGAGGPEAQGLPEAKQAGEDQGQ